jgi:hypothetical protein
MYKSKPLDTLRVISCDNKIKNMLFVIRNNSINTMKKSNIAMANTFSADLSFSSVFASLMILIFGTRI